MPTLRKLRAILQLALVSAMAWGLAVSLLNLGVVLFSGGRLTFAALTDPFLMYAFFGFVAGAVYAFAIALVGVARDQRDLSAARAGWFGALGGAVMFLSVWFGVFGDPTFGSVIGTLVPTAVFALIGAATGLAIRGTAKRAELKSGGGPPSKMIAP